MLPYWFCIVLLKFCLLPIKFPVVPGLYFGSLSTPIIPSLVLSLTSTFIIGLMIWSVSPWSAYCEALILTAFFNLFISYSNSNIFSGTIAVALIWNALLICLSILSFLALLSSVVLPSNITLFWLVFLFEVCTPALFYFDLGRVSQVEDMRFLVEVYLEGSFFAFLVSADPGPSHSVPSWSLFLDSHF